MNVLQQKGKVLPRSRACVGAEVLLGCDRPAVNLIEKAESTTLSLDLEKELAHFFFDEKAALITRSQIEEKDLTLPSRFVPVCVSLCVGRVVYVCVSFLTLITVKEWQAFQREYQTL